MELHCFVFKPKRNVYLVYFECLVHTCLKNASYLTTDQQRQSRERVKKNVNCLLESIILSFFLPVMIYVLSSVRTGFKVVRSCCCARNRKVFVCLCWCLWEGVFFYFILRLLVHLTRYITIFRLNSRHTGWAWVVAPPDTAWWRQKAVRNSDSIFSLRFTPQFATVRAFF